MHPACSIPRKTHRKKGKAGICNFISACLFILFLLPGCTPAVKKVSPSFSGTFHGNSSGGSPVAITLSQKPDSIIGYGKIEGRSFGLSALPSWHAPMAITFEDGSIVQGHITLSSDGNAATVRLPKEELKLQRGGTPVSAPSGPFAGRYAIEEPFHIWVSIAQAGNLIGGTGYFKGKSIAVVGLVTGDGEAKGTMLFHDESRSSVNVKLSDDGQLMTVFGLGNPVQMRRQ